MFKTPGLGRSQVIGLTLVLGTAATVLAVGASAGPPPPTVGPIPQAAFQPGKPLTDKLVPDFVPAMDPDGKTAGYVSKIDLNNNAVIDVPVYAEDLKTVVGYMVPDKGFVPLGVDPNSIRSIPFEAGPSGAPLGPSN